MKVRLLGLLVILIMVTVFTTGMAQEETVATDDVSLPVAYTMNGFTYHAQMWNNCGPATLTMGLSYFGYADSQTRAAAWLKPDTEDKNVSPWQMSEFVNTQIPEIPVYSLYRYGGTLELLKTLLYYNFPVLIEAGYDPPPYDLGWMGHYLLLVAYDDTAEQFTTYDSYDGQNMIYSYEHVEEFWKHFNYTYLVLYDLDRQAELLELLGEDPTATEETNRYTNLIQTLRIAQEDAKANNNDPFAWHNLGTTLTEIAKILDEDVYYTQAAQAFDQARNMGLPWRMAWYQFGMYEAYLATERYDDAIAIAAASLNDGGGHYVEETYYYAGIAREALGETSRAIENYNTALNFNPNFHPARDRRDSLLNG